LALENLTFDEARRALEMATGAQLLAFDQERPAYWHGDLPTRAEILAVLAKESPIRANLDAYLFMESCSGNGYVREEALRALKLNVSRLACAAALIRANDWVPQVNRLAVDMIGVYSRDERARHFFSMLDLVQAQRGRRRFESNWQSIEATLLAPRWRAERAMALENSNVEARRFALELILRADADTSAQALESAVRDSSPHIALWALAAASRLLEGEALRNLLRAAQRTRVARVRADALRRYVRANHSDAGDVLRIALFDPARAPRNVAAFELQRTFGEQALPQWRAAFDQARSSAVVIAALAEHGEDVDEPRLRQGLTHRRARVRAFALRGLWRIGAPDCPGLLDEALLDGSLQFVRTALDIYSRGRELPRRETLEIALARATDPGLRHRLISGARMLGKWEALTFLLARYMECGALADPALDSALQRWELAFNRSFAQLRAEQRTEISRALASLRNSRPSKRWDSLAFFAS
jgi:hypothetical protein